MPTITLIYNNPSWRLKCSSIKSRESTNVNLPVVEVSQKAMKMISTFKLSDAVLMCREKDTLSSKNNAFTTT